MLIPVVLFAIAALGGVTLVALRSQGKNPPLAIALAHGAVAAAGLIALILAVTSAPNMSGPAPIALGVLVVAALGGFFLFSLHLRKKLLPMPVIAIHALVAVTGFGLLVAALLK